MRTEIIHLHLRHDFGLLNIQLCTVKTTPAENIESIWDIDLVASVQGRAKHIVLPKMCGLDTNVGSTSTSNSIWNVSLLNHSQEPAQSKSSRHDYPIATMWY